MARWKLTEKHYLNVPGVEWEQVELSLQTGEQVRKRYAVPKHLNPADPKDQNYKETGEIIVCYKGKGQPRDIVFEGPPTQEMEPLDDEAQALSARVAQYGQHPIESLPEAGPLPNVSAGVSPEAFAILQAQVVSMMKANDELQAKLAEREVDEPLPEIEPTTEEITASEAKAHAAQIAARTTPAIRRGV